MCQKGKLKSATIPCNSLIIPDSDSDPDLDPDPPNQDLDDKPIPPVALCANKVDLPDERAVPRLDIGQ